MALEKVTVLKYMQQLRYSSNYHGSLFRNSIATNNRTWLARLAPPRGAVGFSWHSEARVVEGSLTGPLTLYQVPGILTNQTHALLGAGSYKGLQKCHNRSILEIDLQARWFKTSTVFFGKMTAKVMWFYKTGVVSRRSTNHRTENV